MTRPRRRPWRGLARADDGAVLVEYAFVFPVLMMLVIGIIELGGMAWAQAALSFAVQETARCVSVRPDLCGKPPDIVRYAAAQAPGLDIAPNTLQVKPAPCGQEITATLNYRFLVSPWGMPAATLTARACEP
jgi:Flp pilus assembly protein TadG